MNIPHILTLVRRCLSVFIVVSLHCNPLGFEPVTFGSQVQLPNHVATAAAWILPLKPGVYLLCLQAWDLPKSLSLHSRHIVPLIRLL